MYREFIDTLTICLLCLIFVVAVMLGIIAFAKVIEHNSRLTAIESHLGIAAE